MHRLPKKLSVEERQIVRLLIKRDSTLEDLRLAMGISPTEISEFLKELEKRKIIRSEWSEGNPHKINHKRIALTYRLLKCGNGPKARKNEVLEQVFRP